MAVKQAVNDYLDAVVGAYGAAVRKQTSIEHREGTTLKIRQGKKDPLHVDLEMLKSLTRSLKSYA